MKIQIKTKRHQYEQDEYEKKTKQKVKIQINYVLFKFHLDYIHDSIEMWRQALPVQTNRLI